MENQPVTQSRSLRYFYRNRDNEEYKARVKEAQRKYYQANKAKMIERATNYYYAKKALLAQAEEQT